MRDYVLWGWGGSVKAGRALAMVLHRPSAIAKLRRLRLTLPPRADLILLVLHENQSHAAFSGLGLLEELGGPFPGAFDLAGE